MAIRTIDGDLTVAKMSDAAVPPIDLLDALPPLYEDSVGVLGPDGHWVLKPHWRDVLCEHGGYFFVQEHSGRWGVVSPDGTPLTPFTFRTEKPAIDESIKAQLLIQHFLWWQYRSMQWSIEAARSGCLAIFEGKIAKSHSDQMVFWPWGVSLEEPVTVNDLCGIFSLDNAASYVWESSTSPRDYGFDTLKFCPIKRSGSLCEEAIPIPWAVVSFALPAQDMFDDRRLYVKLARVDHTLALTHLIDSLVALSEGLHLFAIDNSEKKTLADSALDARLLSEQMRGIAMNLLVKIKMPRNPGDLKSFIDGLPERLDKCSFRHLTECRPIGWPENSRLRNNIDNAIRAYAIWDRAFIECSSR